MSKGARLFLSVDALFVLPRRHQEREYIHLSSVRACAEIVREQIE